MSTETTQTEAEAEEVDVTEQIAEILDLHLEDARRVSQQWAPGNAEDKTPVARLMQRVKDAVPAVDINEIKEQIENYLSDNDFRVCEITGHCFRDDDCVSVRYSGNSRYSNSANVNSGFRTFYCECCCETFLERNFFNRSNGAEEFMTDRSGDYCQQCYYEYYCSCNDCGDSMSNDDACYTESGDGPYCSSCSPDDKVLKEVSFNLRLPREATTSADTLAVAWEVEFYPDNGACDASNYDCNQVYYDSSLGNGGQELTTQPVLIENAKQRLENLSDALQGSVNEKCGGHIHVDARYLCKLIFEKGGDCSQYYQNKIAAILPIFQNMLLPLVEPDRTRCQIKNRGFACNVNESLTLSGEKYKTIQTGSLLYDLDGARRTVEFRLWHGTLDRVALYRRAEVCEAMIRFLSKTLENVQSVRQDAKDGTNAEVRALFEDLDRNFNDVYELINRAEGGREHRVRLLDRCRTLLSLGDEWYAWAVAESDKLFAL